MFLVFMAMAAFTACSSDDNDYQWASVPAGDQVYFSKDLPAKQALSKKASSFTIPVNRVKTDAATTVNIALTSEDNFLTAPTSVTFEAGKATADLVLSYDPDALEYDNFKKVSLDISGEGVTTPYGASTYNFTVGFLSPYKSIGVGTMVEDYLFGFTASVQVLQNEENPNVYRVQNGYALKVKQSDAADEASDYIEITLLKPGDTLFDVPVTMSDLVYFTPTSTGFYHEDTESTIWLYHPAHFKSLANENNWVLSRVLAYKEDGTPGQIQLAPRYHLVPDGRGWAANNSADVCVITFPGYAPKDYTATLAAQGIFTDLAGNVFAQAYAELGADATNVKAVVIEADADPEAVADAIAAGELEATDVDGGVINVPIPEGVSGKLQIVLVVLDEDGAVKTVCSSNFEYYGGAASPWESIGIGLLTDNLFITMYSPDGENAFDAQTLPVEIEENNENPGLYRLVDPFKPYADEISYMNYTTANLEVNAIDPEGVYIEMQATGIDDGDGMTYIASTGGYYLASEDFETLKGYGYFGTLKDGVITLPQIPVQDNDGNVKYTYQGIFAQGSSAYYAGTSSEFKLVLPEAVSAEARAKAAKRAKALSFARHLNAYNKVSFKQLKIQMNRKARLTREKMIVK